MVNGKSVVVKKGLGEVAEVLGRIHPMPLTYAGALGKRTTLVPFTRIGKRVFITSVEASALYVEGDALYLTAYPRNTFDLQPAVEGALTAAWIVPSYKVLTAFATQLFLPTGVRWGVSAFSVIAFWSAHREVIYQTGEFGKQFVRGLQQIFQRCPVFGAAVLGVVLGASSLDFVHKVIGRGPIRVLLEGRDVDRYVQDVAKFLAFVLKWTWRLHARGKVGRRPLLSDKEIYALEEKRYGFEIPDNKPKPLGLKTVGKVLKEIYSLNRRLGAVAALPPLRDRSVLIAKVTREFSRVGLTLKDRDARSIARCITKDKTLLDTVEKLPRLAEKLLTNVVLLSAAMDQELLET